jgi:hypothetical protein
VTGGVFGTHGDHGPSGDHVYEEPEEGRRKARGSIGIGNLLQRYNVKRIANMVVEQLNMLS